MVRHKNLGVSFYKFFPERLHYREFPVFSRKLICVGRKLDQRKHGRQYIKDVSSTNYLFAVIKSASKEWKIRLMSFYQERSIIKNMLSKEAGLYFKATRASSSCNTHARTSRDMCDFFHI